MTFAAPFNNLVCESPANHPVIANQNALAGLAAKTYDGSTLSAPTYAPGFINPINIKTLKREINIDSRFRLAYPPTPSTNFHYSLPETFRKVVNMKVTSYNIPLTVYAINPTNNFFTVDASLVALTPGNYNTEFTTTLFTNNTTNLVTEINNVLTNIGMTDLSYVINPVTGRSEFITGATPHTIHFNQDPNGIDNLGAPLALKLGWLLGFRGGSYTIAANSTLTSEAIVTVASPAYIYMCVNDHTNAGNNNFVAIYNESTISPNIIARIQYQYLIQEYGIYNIGTSDEGFSAIREYFGPVDIQKLDLQMLDEYGRVVDFNGMDWSCTIQFEILYD